MIRAPSSRPGRANFTTIEEIPPGEDILAGTLYLFDSPRPGRANFMSVTEPP
jgi:hypothetical protein